MGNTPLLNEIKPILVSHFGEIDHESAMTNFTFTDYYAPEMGRQLCRCWLSFRARPPLVRLAELKLKTNGIEDEYRDSAGNRRINLDPGLVTRHNLVLATTKDYSHRIYLGRGIFAEVTLIYAHGEFQTLPWTYPDYQLPETRAFFARVRQALLCAD